MKFWDFPNLSYFLKILSLKSFSNLWGNSYIPCLLLIITLLFTCGEKKMIKYKVSKSLKISFLWLYLLGVVTSHHCMQFQGKLMNQTQKNGQKPSARLNFSSFWPKFGPPPKKKIVLWVLSLLDVMNCCKI